MVPTVTPLYDGKVIAVQVYPRATMPALRTWKRCW
jgi:hypothetical protein